jgi:WD40 repeat protein
MSLLAFSPPSLQIVTVGITGSATANAIGCPAPRGFLNIISTLGPVINLGTGSFVAKQFFLSLDTSKAYILAQTGTGAHFPFILVFDVASGTSSQISLAGNAIPLSAGVSPAGDLLLVGASDNSVHVIDTQSGLDLQQVALSFPNASLCIGPGNPATQVAIASLTISSAQQSGTNTIFTYSLQNGATPQVGQTLVLTGMSDGGNNGTFTILAVNAATSSSGTITVSNPAGVAASGQAGTGTVPLTCNPDLLVVP